MSDQQELVTSAPLVWECAGAPWSAQAGRWQCAAGRLAIAAVPADERAAEHRPPLAAVVVDRWAAHVTVARYETETSEDVGDADREGVEVQDRWVALTADGRYLWVAEPLRGESAHIRLSAFDIQAARVTEADGSVREAPCALPPCKCPGASSASSDAVSSPECIPAFCLLHARRLEEASETPSSLYSVELFTRSGQVYRWRVDAEPWERHRRSMRPLVREPTVERVANGWQLLWLHGVTHEVYGLSRAAVASGVDATPPPVACLYRHRDRRWIPLAETSAADVEATALSTDASRLLLALRGGASWPCYDLRSVPARPQHLAAPFAVHSIVPWTASMMLAVGGDSAELAAIDCEQRAVHSLGAVDGWGIRASSSERHHVVTAGDMDVVPQRRPPSRWQRLWPRRWSAASTGAGSVTDDRAPPTDSSSTRFVASSRPQHAFLVSLRPRTVQVVAVHVPGTAERLHALVMSDGGLAAAESFCHRHHLPPYLPPLARWRLSPRDADAARQLLQALSTATMDGDPMWTVLAREVWAGACADERAERVLLRAVLLSKGEQDGTSSDSVPVVALRRRLELLELLRQCETPDVAVSDRAPPSDVLYRRMTAAQRLGGERAVARLLAASGQVAAAIAWMRQCHLSGTDCLSLLSALPETLDPQAYWALMADEVLSGGGEDKREVVSVLVQRCIDRVVRIDSVCGASVLVPRLLSVARQALTASTAVGASDDASVALLNGWQRAVTEWSALLVHPLLASLDMAALRRVPSLERYATAAPTERLEMAWRLALQRVLDSGAVAVETDIESAAAVVVEEVLLRGAFGMALVSGLEEGQVEALLEETSVRVFAEAEGAMAASVWLRALSLACEEAAAVEEADDTSSTDRAARSGPWTLRGCRRLLEQAVRRFPYALDDVGLREAMQCLQRWGDGMSAERVSRTHALLSRVRDWTGQSISLAEWYAATETGGSLEAASTHITHILCTLYGALAEQHRLADLHLLHALMRPWLHALPLDQLACVLLERYDSSDGLSMVLVEVLAGMSDGVEAGVLVVRAAVELFEVEAAAYTAMLLLQQVYAEWRRGQCASSPGAGSKLHALDAAVDALQRTCRAYLYAGDVGLPLPEPAAFWRARPTSWMHYLYQVVLVAVAADEETSADGKAPASDGVCTSTTTTTSSSSSLSSAWRPWWDTTRRSGRVDSSKNAAVVSERLAAVQHLATLLQLEDETRHLLVRQGHGRPEWLCEYVEETLEAVSHVNATGEHPLEQQQLALRLLWACWQRAGALQRPRLERALRAQLVGGGGGQMIDLKWVQDYYRVLPTSAEAVRVPCGMPRQHIAAVALQHRLAVPALWYAVEWSALQPSQWLHACIAVWRWRQEQRGGAEMNGGAVPVLLPLPGDIRLTTAEPSAAELRQSGDAKRLRPFAETLRRAAEVRAWLFPDLSVDAIGDESGVVEAVEQFLADAAVRQRLVYARLAHRPVREGAAALRALLAPTMPLAEAFGIAPAECRLEYVRWTLLEEAEEGVIRDAVPDARILQCLVERDGKAEALRALVSPWAHTTTTLPSPPPLGVYAVRAVAEQPGDTRVVAVARAIDAGWLSDARWAQRLAAPAAMLNAENTEELAGMLAGQSLECWPRWWRLVVDTGHATGLLLRQALVRKMREVPATAAVDARELLRTVRHCVSIDGMSDTDVEGADAFGAVVLSAALDGGREASSSAAALALAEELHEAFATDGPEWSLSLRRRLLQTEVVLECCWVVHRDTALKAQGAAARFTAALVDAVQARDEDCRDGSDAAADRLQAYAQVAAVAQSGDWSAEVSERAAVSQALADALPDADPIRQAAKTLSEQASKGSREGPAAEENMVVVGTAADGRRGPEQQADEWTSFARALIHRIHRGELLPAGALVARRRGMHAVIATHPESVLCVLREWLQRYTQRLHQQQVTALDDEDVQPDERLQAIRALALVEAVLSTWMME
ncbi:hypothetical protein CDCA_CDCA05G1557 [Cyanidium caldarium]|uniref:Uncharacterized protein n=1 Tax=Cyanidium caldarium TaxID=2771 RepID=A0AAV9IT77_CYACA|nr:hypothetical protein CDCA_CDCA05G1557 [Cyanidium caldarium]